MADLSEVLQSIVDCIAGIVYPNGTGAASIVNKDVMVYPGWPVPEQLDLDMIDGNKVHISVFSRPEERNTTRGASLQELYFVGDGDDVGTVVKVVGRQEQLIQITTWAPTPDVRNAICKAIIPVLSDIRRLMMPDGTSAQVVYRNSVTDDNLQKAGIYRRELFYYVEYATTKISSEFVVKSTVVNVTEQ